MLLVVVVEGGVGPRLVRFREGVIGGYLEWMDHEDLKSSPRESIVG